MPENYGSNRQKMRRALASDQDRTDNMNVQYV
jgi:hypothetical protein